MSPEKHTERLFPKGRGADKTRSAPADRAERPGPASLESRSGANSFKASDPAMTAAQGTTSG
jgi:hypothetical protein